MKALVALAVLMAPFAGAQSAPRFGVLFWHDSPNDAAALTGLRAAFEEAHVVPKPIWDVAQADDDPQRAQEILAGFQADGAALIFAMGTQAALLCRKHVTETPVVFTAVTNPVESGVVEGWGGSGTNLCGNSNWIEPSTVLAAFRMAVPRMTRLGVLRSKRSQVVSAAELRGMRRYIEEEDAGVTIVEEVIDAPDDIPGAVRSLVQSSVDAIWIGIDKQVYSNMSRVFEASRPAGVPLLSSSLRGTRNGAVAGIVVDYEMLGARAAVLALDVLRKGREPADIPVGRMSGYRIVVNLGAAEACGYELPLSLLVLADVLLEEIQNDGT